MQMEEFHVMINSCQLRDMMSHLIPEIIQTKLSE
jgi:hypothetical protein